MVGGDEKILAMYEEITVNQTKNKEEYEDETEGVPHRKGVGKEKPWNIQNSKWNEVQKTTRL